VTGEFLDASVSNEYMGKTNRLGNLLTIKEHSMMVVDSSTNSRRLTILKSNGSVRHQDGCITWQTSDSIEPLRGSRIHSHWIYGFFGFL